MLVRRTSDGSLPSEGGWLLKAGRVFKSPVAAQPTPMTSSVSPCAAHLADERLISFELLGGPWQ